MKKLMTKIPRWAKIVGVVFIALFIGAGIDSANDPPKPPEPKQVEESQEEPEKPAEPEKTEEELHDEWVEAQFSKWDGSHRNLIKLVKENLNDPDSFEHVETTYSMNGNDLVVHMDYRAKNGFGAKILCGVTANVSYEYNTITIVSTD